ncbi:hypothetical protein LP420_12405 [Massilia sp. B-10]|nr:hypothetical protein LP420_12405 [Massilia sp. B-10]
MNIFNFLDNEEDDDSSTLLRKAFEKIAATGSQTLILDLRNNGGGQDALGKKVLLLPGRPALPVLPVADREPAGPVVCSQCRGRCGRCAYAGALKRVPTACTTTARTRTWASSSRASRRFPGR